jgi:hypothetical protein
VYEVYEFLETLKAEKKLQRSEGPQQKKAERTKTYQSESSLGKKGLP